MTERIKFLPAHSAFYIIKNSQAIPSLSHLLRCSPAWACKQQLQVFDDNQRSALQGILNVNFTNVAWDQASLPIRFGGLGMRLASTLASPAFLASSSNTSDLVCTLLPQYVTLTTDAMLQQCLSQWQETTDFPAPPLEKRHIQGEWLNPCFEKLRRQALEQAPNPFTKARLQSVASAVSGAFLQARPSPSLGTLLQDEELRVAISLRLGLPTHSSHSCTNCGVQVESHSTHGLSCRLSAGRFTRHATVNDILKRALSSAEIPATLEPSHLTTESNIRPDGMSLIPWTRGKAVIWDYTCCDSTAASYVSSSSVEPIFAATSAERLKDAKYACLAESHFFVPIASECLGSFGPRGMAFLRELGRRIQAVTGETRSTEFLLQRLSIAIQKGNAKAIIGSIPKGPTLSEDNCYL